MRCMQFGIFNRYVSMSRDVVIGLFFIGLTFLRTMSLIMISPIAMSRERCLSDNDASDSVVLHASLDTGQLIGRLSLCCRCDCRPS